MDFRENIFALQGKVVCITGSSRGLGKSLGKYFAGAGARVILSSYDQNELDEAAEEFAQCDLEVDCFLADVSKSQDCEGLINHVITRFKKIDTLICNAGIDQIKPATDYSEQEWDRILNVNLRGAYYCARFAALEMMKQRSGSIIITSSVAGQFGIKGLTPYAASKGGVNQLVKTLAVEWADHGIRVNAVAPGYIENVMKGVTFDDKDPYQQRVLSRTLMGRRGKLHEFSGAYLFLASDAASYITGQIINVDGGYSCW